MKIILVSILGLLFSLLCSISAWSVSNVKGFKSFTVGALLGVSILNVAVVPPALADVSLQQQLRELQTKKTENIKKQYESAEMAAMNQELTYQPGYLLARCGVLLNQDQKNLNLQMGYSSLNEFDPIFDTPDATLFLIAVGRTEPGSTPTPAAAKKYKISEIESFPTIIEITTDDLLFPYTPDAWVNSASSSDTVIVTAVVSPTDRLADSSNPIRLGAAASEPTRIAGSLQRSTANININAKIDSKGYSQEELTILTGVDISLAKKENGKAFNAK